jgi:homogentisate 1,2-dioxygenase
VVVVHLLPRPAEGREGTERLPWYHRNADYDEVILYHGGSFLGTPLPAGLISHAPQGIHHGPPERAREHARQRHHDFSRVEWQMISFDVTRPLTVSEAFRAAAGEPA